MAKLVALGFVGGDRASLAPEKNETAARMGSSCGSDRSPEIWGGGGVRAESCQDGSLQTQQYHRTERGFAASELWDF